MEIVSIVGPFIAIMGLGVLMNYKRTMSMMTEVMDSKGMVFIMGMISLLFGLFIINSGIIAVGWELWIVCVLGWASCIKGFLLLVFPKIMKSLSGSMMKGNELLIQGFVFLVALVGLWLTWTVYMV